MVIYITIKATETQCKLQSGKRVNCWKLSNAYFNKKLFFIELTGQPLDDSACLYPCHAS